MEENTVEQTVVEEPKKKFNLKAYIAENKTGLLKKTAIVAGAVIGVVAIAALVHNEAGSEEIIEGSAIDTPMDEIPAESETVVEQTTIEP